jgi:hypothetical protein
MTTTTILDRLGLNRDSLSLFWAKWFTFVLALAPMGADVTKYGIPARWVPFIQFAALFISVSCAQHRRSDLPGDHPPAAVLAGNGAPATANITWITLLSGSTAAALILTLLLPATASAQVGTEPLAWAPEHRALADALGTIAVSGQATGAAVTSWRAWRAGDHKPAFRVGCSIGLAMLTTESLKRLVHEVRPDGTDDKSWPSGHSAAGAALSGWNFSIGFPLGAFIGLSRVNANRHHLVKDVLPGLAFGAASQAVCSAVFR